MRILCFFLFSLFFTQISAQSLDLTYDGDGWAEAGLSKSTSHFVWDCGVQSDDKVISYTQRSGIETEVIRLDQNGNPDGLFTTINTTGVDQARAIAISSTDKVYTASRTSIPGSTIRRYNADGTVDASYSAVTTSFTIYRLALDGAGNLMAVGAEGTQAVIARFLSTGAIDASFGTGGSVKLNNGWGRDVLISGTEYYFLYNDNSGTIAKLTKHDNNGNFVTSFGSGGLAQFTAASGVSCLDIHEVSSGIILVGNANTGSFFTPVSIKLDASTGAVDPAYGASGYAITGINAFTPVNTQMSVLVGGDNIAFIFRGGSLSSTEVGLGLFQPDGNLNPAFGSFSGYEKFSYTEALNTQSLNIDNAGRLLINSSYINSSTSMSDIVVTRIDVPSIFFAPLSSVSVYGSMHIQSLFQLTPMTTAPTCTTQVEQGKIYFDKTLQKLRVCTSGGWESLH